MAKHVGGKTGREEREAGRKANNSNDSWWNGNVRKYQYFEAKEAREYSKKVYLKKKPLRNIWRQIFIADFFHRTHRKDILLMGINLQIFPHRRFLRPAILQNEVSTLQ